MSDYKLVRLVRTPSSEVYLLWDDATRLGQVDVHYAEGLVHATVVLEHEIDRDAIEALISQLDDDVISSYLPEFERDDLFITVYVGEEVMSYTDGEDEDDEDDE